VTDGLKNTRGRKNSERAIKVQGFEVVWVRSLKIWVFFYKEYDYLKITDEQKKQIKEFEEFN